MRKLNLTWLIGLAALASGCATKQQQETTYWTEKAGIPVVHHVVGQIDSTEKLSETPLTSKEADAHHLPKGKYFKVVESHVTTPVNPSKTADAKPKTDAKKDADKKLEAVTHQLTDMKGQISQIADDNKRLHEQLDAAKANSEPSPTPDPEAPKVSQ